MRTFFKFIVVLLILASGGLIAKTLIDSKPTAAHKPISIGVPLVEVITASPRNEQIKIVAMGTVIPAREVALQAQVSGQIVEINPKLIPGGIFKTGEILLRVDERDYRIAMEQRKADIARAVMELRTEKSRQSIAEQEWKLLGSEIASTEEGRDLALRKPQIANAQAALDSARSSLEKARLDVERARIRTFFNAFVKEKFVDLGQHVTPGTKLATLSGTDEFWVQISVPVSRLSWIAIPGVNNQVSGSRALVIQESGSPDAPRTVRQGQVIRLLGDLDPVGRMARLLVAVEDPLGLRDPEAASVPLLLGAYVNVEIEGPTLEDVFVIPRHAFREDDQVWLMTGEKKLSVKKADVLWRRKQDVLLRGLNPGDKIITSRIPAPVEGMELRISGPGLRDVE